MRKCKIALITVAVITASFSLMAQSRHLTASEAKSHVVERATVCGTVASTHYSAKTKGSPTFLNLDQPYPNQVFTILIWGSDRSKFGAPESMYANKKVCVTGAISEYRGIAEVVVENPRQIEVQ